MPAWLIALIPSLKDIFKTIGQWLWGYVKSMWDNAWILAWASTCTTLFLLIMGTLNSWFSFPAILNIGIHGIYHLGNAGWVISNWKTSPVQNNSNNSGSKVNVS
jgi:hypothetical protein